MPARKIRARGALPANWKFRDGRPRWEPGPGLRQAGWKGHDLKDPRTGQWLTEGASIDKAREINAGVDAWRGGQLIPGGLAGFSPPGACGAPSLTRAEREDRRSIGRLMDRYAGPLDAKFKAALPQASREFQDLQPETQRQYRSRLRRLLDTLAGRPIPPTKGGRPEDIEAHRDNVRRVRAMSIDVFDPPPFGSTDQPVLKLAYQSMRDALSLNAAVGMMRVASAWLRWCVEEDRSVAINAAKLVKMKQPRGRIRTGTWAELAALVASADVLGMPSIGDSVIFGVDLSWSQGDRLALTWPQISAEHRVRGIRKKTGRVGETRLLPSLGIPRIAAIRRRQAELYGDGNQHTHVLVCESTGRRWTDSHYRTHFAEVRAHAAKTCPSVIDLHDQDLRDTAVTVAYEAGLTIPEIASRTLHSLKQIHDILDAHYGDINRAVGDNGAEKLEAYMVKLGVTL